VCDKVRLSSVMVPEAFPLDSRFLGPLETCMGPDAKGCLGP